MTASLPTEKQKPKKGFPKSGLWLIYGQPKVGKTTLVSQFPNCLILDLEGGAEQVEGFVKRINNMEELRETYDALAAKEGQKFETIAIDSIDVLNEWVEKEACEFLSKKFKTEIENIGEGAKGSDWAEARKRLMGTVEAWRQLGKNIIFVAHCKQVSGETGATAATQSKTIDLPGKLAHRFPARVDAIGFCYAVKESSSNGSAVKRYVSFQPYDNLEAGCRWPELHGKIVPMSFEAIKACFENNDAEKRRK